MRGATYNTNSDFGISAQERNEKSSHIRAVHLTVFLFSALSY